MSIPVPCLVCKEPSSYPLVEEEVNFLLRQVLQVPDSLFTKEPFEVSLALCEDCCELVGECQEVHEELCSNQRKWNECRTAVIRRIKATATGEEEEVPGGGHDAMRLETRRFVVNHGYAFCESVGMAEEQEAAVPPEADGAPGTTVQGMNIDVNENAVARTEEDVGPPVAEEAAGESGDEDPPTPVNVAATGAGGEIGANSRKVSCSAGVREDDAPGGGADATGQFVLNQVYACRELVGWGQLAEGDSAQEAADESDDDSGTVENRELPVASTSRTTECLFCSRKLSCNSHLIRHMRVHTWERPFWCALCHREFTHKWDLKSHQRIHSGEKRALRLSLECLFCRKKFGRNWHLEAHMRVHTRERPFWCDVCGKELKLRGDLHRHLLMHSGEKPHQCKLCPKRFSSSGNLSRHVRAHLGEKPFKCPDCEKAFVGKQELTSHRVVHTREKPFKCDQCSRKFAWSRQLLRHRKKGH